MTTDAPVETPGRARAVTAVAVVAVALVVVDQLTKQWAEATLTGRPPIPVLGDVISFRLLYNPGAAFSIGSGATWVFTLLAAGAVVGIAYASFRIRSARWALAAGLLLGGATTHLGDRLFRAPGFAMGHVVDFIDYNGWFVGNVADIALGVGAVLVVLLTLLGVPAGGPPRAPQPEPVEAQGA